jgi:outer membrane lipoprotein-sorting protein
MKKLSAVLMIVSIALTLWGQDKELGESEPEAKKLLKKVSKKYEGYDNMRVVFTLAISTPENDVNDERSGTLYLKGDMYKLEMGKQEVINNGETVWTFLKDAKEVQVNNYNPDKDDNITPTDIFTIYDQDFLAAMNEEVASGDNSVKVIDMTPYEKDKNYFKIRLRVSSSDYSIKSAKIFEKNGNRYTYNIKKFAADLNMPDSFFTFDKSEHPDVDVIDMR